MKRYDEYENVHEFGYGELTSVTMEEINEAIKTCKKKGFVDFKVGIDYGYYEGEEHLALFGKKKEK